jgi:hypothetical protein
MKLVYETGFVGVMTVVVGLIVTWVVGLMRGHPSKTKNATDWAYCALVFFITGVLIHIICEYTRINKWYCKHGNACQ